MTVLGHLQRGGTPTAFDRVLATRFGVAAVDLAAAGRFGEMAALRGTEIVGVPLAEACAEVRGVDPALLDVAADVLRVARCCPRLVAIDLDGTLLRSDRTVSRPLAGRRSPPRERPASRSSSRPPARRAARGPIAADAGIGGLAICANGATVYDLDDGRDRAAHAAARRRPRTGSCGGCASAVPGIVFGWEHELRFGSEPAYEALRESAWWPRPDDSLRARATRSRGPCR